MKTSQPRLRPAPTTAPHTDGSRQAQQPSQADAAMASSPRMTAQRRAIRAAFGPAVADLAPRGVLQREPFVVDPLTSAEVDLGDAKLTLEQISALYDRMPYQMQDRYARRFRQAMKARRGAPGQFPELQDAPKADAKAESVTGSAGRKIIAATNALKAGGGSSTADETKPLVYDAKRDERVGASAAKDVATTAIGSAVSIATGGVSGKVQSVGSVLASGAKIAQIDDILTRAKSAYANTHNQSQSASLPQLIGALGAVMKSQWFETLGKGVGVVVPGAGSVAAAAAKSPEDLQTIATLAAEGNALAIEAAQVLGLKAMGDAKTTYS